MGVMQCKQHGTQGVSLVCPHVRLALLADTPLTGVREVRLAGDMLDGQSIVYPLCDLCLDSFGLDHTLIGDLDWETWFERLTLEPVCGQCYQLARRPSS
jgi:hypothetical protein